MQPPASDRLWLPQLLRDMADEHGLDIALAFGRRFGGRYLHLPIQPHAEHPVAEAFGVVLLAWLIDRHDRLQRIVVPRGPDMQLPRRVAAVGEMTAQGYSADAIAAALEIHVRDVHRYRARLRAGDKRQLTLF